MLCNLVIENYALISKLEIEFRKGMTIITGETGAGKSILLGALSLILGKRADTNVLYDKEKKCIVEGTFDIGPYDLAVFFEEKSIDYEEQTILRREISTAGKSRAFINDVPVNLDLLTELGSRLIDIHSQHQNLSLSESIFQMKVLDSYAQSGELLNKYQALFKSYKLVRKKYDDLKAESEKAKTDLDYMQFQLSQLEEAKLAHGEQEELEMELEKLEHSEEIKTALTSITTLLQGEGESALQQIKDSSVLIEKISRYLHGNENLAERMHSAYIELRDLAREIELISNQLFFDPERLGEVNDRLNLIYNLEKKHHLDRVELLIQLRDDLKKRVADINSYDFNLSSLENQVKETENALQAEANKLSQKRKDTLSSLEKSIMSLLGEVGIPNAVFIVQLDKAGEYTLTGSDTIRFLFSANRNTNPQDISRVASGGELSRLMLCIKSLLSNAVGMPTIIFDEIDTGVSGDIAEKVGNIIFRMSSGMQVINITHLPQVASKGENHFLVYKTDEGKTTTTRVKLLNKEERQIEIAKMLSGEEISPAALENARTLLGD